ncbi:MAG: DUF1304 domain-containing protein [Granulosicoccus sp.]|nr:DUF1304 domain-containing protein [Granulosicoccus sp.]
MISIVIVALVALLHLYILWLEMFQWESRGPKVFRQFPKDLFAPTKAMAANQGLYNGFLAAGLIWSLFISDSEWQSNIALCFLLFVFIAGLYGAVTASKKILFVQALPAAIGILAVLFT